MKIKFTFILLIFCISTKAQQYAIEGYMLKIELKILAYDSVKVPSYWFFIPLGSKNRLGKTIILPKDYYDLGIRLNDNAIPLSRNVDNFTQISGCCLEQDANYFNKQNRLHLDTMHQKYSVKYLLEKKDSNSKTISFILENRRCDVTYTRMIAKICYCPYHYLLDNLKSNDNCSYILQEIIITKILKASDMEYIQYFLNIE